MPNLDDTQTPPTPTDEAQDQSRRRPRASQVAAAVEAAYILEAVRK
jgi:hypothetical protein